MLSEAFVEKLDAEKSKAVLVGFLRQFMDPAFGSLPKREVELLVFDMLRELGAMGEDASLYTLMSQLRVTRSKASQLLFDHSVRRLATDSAGLDQAIIKALVQTRFSRDGDYFVVEVENPLVQAHLKEKLRGLEHASDSSFNAALVRMSPDAAGALIAALLPREQKEEVRRGLVEAGAPDKTLGGVLKSALKALGGKVVGAAADTLVEGAAGYLTPLFGASADAIARAWAGMFDAPPGAGREGSTAGTRRR